MAGRWLAADTAAIKTRSLFVTMVSDRLERDHADELQQCEETEKLGTMVRHISLGHGPFGETTTVLTLATRVALSAEKRLLVPAIGGAPGASVAES